MQFNSLLLYFTSILEAIVEIWFLMLRVIILYIKKKNKKTTFFVRDISVACGLLVYAELRSDVWPLSCTYLTAFK